jgi:hypothetical protein
VSKLLRLLRSENCELSLVEDHIRRFHGAGARGRLLHNDHRLNGSMCRTAMVSGDRAVNGTNIVSGGNR